MAGACRLFLLPARVVCGGVSRKRTTGRCLGQYGDWDVRVGPAHFLPNALPHLPPVRHIQTPLSCFPGMLSFPTLKAHVLLQRGIFVFLGFRVACYTTHTELSDSESTRFRCREGSLIFRVFRLACCTTHTGPSKTGNTQVVAEGVL